MFIIVFKETDEKSKETTATSDSKSSDVKPDEGTNTNSVIKLENEATEKTDIQEESNVSSLLKNFF